MPKLRVLSVGSQLVNAPETTNAANEKDVNNRPVRLKAMMVEVPTADIQHLGDCTKPRRIVCGVAQPRRRRTA